MCDYQANFKSFLKKIEQGIARWDYHRYSLASVYLIGSRSNENLHKNQEFSDIDFVLIVGVEIGFEHQEIAKRDFIKITKKSELGMNRRIGVRCRGIDEYDGFSRYLQLQGYQMRDAHLLFGEELRCHSNMKVCSKPTKQEYLCVLNECLWTDIRFRSYASVEFRKSAYLATKLILSYANAYALSYGKYLSEQPALISSGILPGIEKPTLDLLHNRTRRELEKIPIGLLLSTLKRIRTLTIERGEEINLENGTANPIHFWFDVSAQGIEFNTGSVDASATKLSLVLYRSLMRCDLGHHVDNSIDYNCSVRNAESCERLNQLRFANSTAAMRDWSMKYRKNFERPIVESCSDLVQKVEEILTYSQ